MTKFDQDQTARQLLKWATTITPLARRSWVKAMIAEFDAVNAGERLRFALGCFSFAVSSWTRTRQGIAWIGRGAIASDLWAISGVGVYVASRLGDVPSLTLLAACGIYAIGGAVALFSLSALQRFAIFVGACAGGAYLLANTASPDWTGYYSTIALEAAILMAALLTCANLLKIIGSDHATNT